jgi:hypothetical protein
MKRLMRIVFKLLWRYHAFRRPLFELLDPSPNFIMVWTGGSHLPVDVRRIYAASLRTFLTLWTFPLFL